MADVNAPPCSPKKFNFDGVSGSALDIAAEFGGIEMVKLLLNCNALSDTRGETGYDGAINLAIEEGHLAVADLVRQHTKDAERSDTKSPYLSQPARDWHYGYELDPNEDSEYSGWGTCTDEQTDTEDEADSAASTDHNQQDLSDPAYDLDVRNSTHPPDREERPMAASHETVFRAYIPTNCPF